MPIPETELVTVDPDTGEVLEAHALALVHPPDRALADAIATAKALQDVIARSTVPAVRFGGKMYLEFHHWQTIAAPFGVTTRVESVAPIVIEDVRGFHAVAVAINRDGRQLSRAESFCMSDEANWRGKPLFQLASMAQTRAQAKVLRNIFSNVAVLAGYSATPAEEMTGEEQHARASAAASSSRPATASLPLDRSAGNTISIKQAARLKAIAHDAGWTNNALALRLQTIGITNPAEMLRTEYDAFIDYLRAGPPGPPRDEAEDEDPPF